MIWVEPGTFTDGAGGVVSRHNVTLTKGFYLGKYEVTQSTVRGGDERAIATMV